VGHAAGFRAAGRRVARRAQHHARPGKSRRAACWPIHGRKRLGPRFAGQWLRLQDVDKVHPDPNFYPNFEGQLGDLMKRETELFFNSLVQRGSAASSTCCARITRS
jgi:hypothetical protein